MRELEKPERSLLLRRASDSQLRSMQHSQRLDQRLHMLKQEIGVMVSVCADLDVLRSMYNYFPIQQCFCLSQKKYWSCSLYVHYKPTLILIISLLPYLSESN